MRPPGHGSVRRAALGRGGGGGALQERLQGDRLRGAGTEQVNRTGTQIEHFKNNTFLNSSFMEKVSQVQEGDDRDEELKALDLQDWVSQ